MTPELLSLLGVFISGGLLTGVLVFITARRKFPVEKQSAVVEDSVKINDMALNTLARVDAELTTLKAEVKDLKKHSDVQDGEISTLRRHLDMWVAWAEGLRFNWSSVRQNENPPDLPNPRQKELR